MKPHSRGYQAGLDQDAGGEAQQTDNVAFLYHNHIFTGLHTLAFLVARCGYVTNFWLIKCEWKVYPHFPVLPLKGLNVHSQAFSWELTWNTETISLVSF